MMSTTWLQKICSHFELEDAILEDIKQGYDSDSFTEKITNAAAGMTNIQQKNGFWFIDNCLVIPNAP